MSTDLITYSSALPDFLREAGGYRDEGMTGGIAPKAPKLSMTTSKQWTISDGAATTILQTQYQDAQGNTHVIPAPTVKGVIIASSETLTKAWYEKAFVPGTNAAPDCFSNDGKVPAPGVAKPQCSNCAQCPKNAFGSHPVTGRGKACGDRKMLVVALDTMPDKYATFNVPTMSLASLRNIDGLLREKNIPLQSVMMEFSFDPAITYPAVKIGAIGFIGKEHFEKFRDAADSDDVRQLLREVDYEAPPETAAQQPVVPNNQIAFGSGSQTGTAQVETKPAGPTPEELAAKAKAEAVAKAKAAYEAAMAEAAGDSNETTTTHTQTGQASETQQQQTQTAGVLDGLQANTAGNTANGAAAPAKRTRRTKAEMEALRAQEAGQQQLGGNALEQGIATALTQEVVTEPVTEQAQTPTPAAATDRGAGASGAPNVLDLLSKWGAK